MTRLVLNSNVYVSALLFGGNPRQIVTLAVNGRIELCLSDSISTEVERVLHAKFGWSPERVARAAGFLWSLALRVEPQRRVSDCLDPNDNRVLECALEANAGWIVTGDHHLLCMHSYQGIEIATPRRFLESRAWENR